MGIHTSEKKKGEEKVIRWEGKLIPRSIIIAAFLNEEQKAIDAIEAMTTENQNQLDEEIESAEEDSIFYL